MKTRSVEVEKNVVLLTFSKPAHYIIGKAGKVIPKKRGCHEQEYAKRFEKDNSIGIGNHRVVPQVLPSLL